MAHDTADSVDTLLKSKIPKVQVSGPCWVTGVGVQEHGGNLPQPPQDVLRVRMVCMGMAIRLHVPLPAQCLPVLHFLVCSSPAALTDALLRLPLPCPAAAAYA